MTTDPKVLPISNAQSGTCLLDSEMPGCRCPSEIGPYQSNEGGWSCVALVSAWNTSKNVLYRDVRRVFVFVVT